MNEKIIGYIIFAVAVIVSTIIMYITGFFGKTRAGSDNSGIEELERRAGTDNQALADTERGTRESIERARAGNSKIIGTVGEQTEDNKRAEANNKRAAELIKRAEEILKS